MGEVLALELDEAARSALTSAAADMGDALHETDITAAFRILESRNGCDVHLVILGTNVQEPVRTAQRIYVADPEIPVLALVERSRYAHVCRAVDYTPYLPQYFKCIHLDEPDVASAAVHDAIERVRTMRAHRATIGALNARLSFVPSDVKPPAILGGILDSAPIGVVVVDATGHVRAWNRKSGEMLGRTERAALGMPFEEFLPDDGRKAWREGIEPVLRGDQPMGRGASQGSVDGRVRHIDITATGLPTPEKSTLLIIEDVTERVQLVDELRNAVRARDEFMSIASHELRTPLTSIQLLAQTLSQAADAINPTQVKAQAQSIQRGVARLTALVENLLDVSRIDQKRLELDCEDVDVMQLVGDVVERYRLGCERSKCEVRVMVITPAGRAHWDRLRFEQVLSNLLDNAIKYGPGKPISIELRGDAKAVTIVVSDQGIGIPLDVQSRIFERFERAVSRRNYGGLGLGLWIARRIVEAHRGRISVESRPGAGAQFTVELPRHFEK